MKAWLVTWDWMSDSEAVADRVLTIVSSRKSAERVAELVEFLYSQATSTLAELAAYARSPKNRAYRAKTVEMINGVPHGDRITCGAHPWLYARLVTDLRIARDPETSVEQVSWTEPPTFRFSEDGSRIVEDAPGQRDFVRRVIVGPPSSAAIWDRVAGTFRPEFGAPAA